ncbi:MAG: hypothetical protein ACLUS6_04415 [Dysosmobacter sp.]
MRYVTEPSKQLPVAAETEILVVGGGPAGFGAGALSRARMGCQVMLYRAERRRGRRGHPAAS